MIVNLIWWRDMWLSRLRELLSLWRKRRAPPASIVTLRAGITTMGTSVNWNASLNPPVISWTSPTTRADGSALALTDIASFDVFYQVGTAAPVKSLTITNGIVASMSAAIDTSIFSAPGTYTFTVTTKDKSGNVSASSNGVEVVVSLAPPATISNLSVAIN